LSEFLTISVPGQRSSYDFAAVLHMPRASARY
jgi:hypothetical protein